MKTNCSRISKVSNDPNYTLNSIKNEVETATKIMNQGLRRELEYQPLALLNIRKKIEKQQKNGKKILTKVTWPYLREHQGDPSDEDIEASKLDLIDSTTILGKQINDGVKLLICITLYNEPYYQLIESLIGVYRNYFELCKKDKSYENQVSIVIIADGFDTFDSVKTGDMKLSEQLAKAGIYDETKMIPNYLAIDKDGKKIKKEPVALSFMSKIKNIMAEGDNVLNMNFDTHNLIHCFSKLMTFEQFFQGLDEHTQKYMQVDGYHPLHYLYGDILKGAVKNKIFSSLPLNVHFAVKHFNRGKIESHLWYFKGFCQAINPKYCHILDAGTIATPKSFSTITLYMDCHKQVGGACGEIEVILPTYNEDGTPISFVKSFLLRAQYVEYKLSHYVDKAAESLFGFVSVLPGAFSCFRFKAIKGEPLDRFLQGKTLTDPNNDSYPDCYLANQFLAEDRIMCLEIIAKENDNNIIKYVPGCKALTDAPSSLSSFIKQRRRWFNGSTFASFHVIKNMCRTWKRDNSCLRNLFFMILYVYMLSNVLLGFILVGLYYAAFSIFLRSVLPSDDCISVSDAANVLENLYLVFLFFCFIICTAVKIQWAEIHFRICSFIMGLFSLLMFITLIAGIVQEDISGLSLIFIAIVVLVIIVPLILHLPQLKLLDFIKGTLYSFFLIPTYINIMIIFAISNIHDVSWGSRPKGADITISSLKKMNMTNDYENFRSRFLLFWVLINATAGWSVVYLSREGQDIYLAIVSGILAGVVGLKFLLSLLHVIQSTYNNWKVKRYLKREGKEERIFIPDPEETHLLFNPFQKKTHSISNPTIETALEGMEALVSLSENDKSTFQTPDSPKSQSEETSRPKSRNIKRPQIQEDSSDEEEKKHNPFQRIPHRRDKIKSTPKQNSTFQNSAEDSSREISREHRSHSHSLEENKDSSNTRLPILRHPTDTFDSRTSFSTPLTDSD
ncbi:unnamed protein product [Moneuplotes crassus]|uniref:chitin synthase n=1 Tax=Euplotes crassus TaxID=5936 RepID=A0AAD1X9E8_EUPCR|nr:unnamed protein product [Moneuplotes crassus]